MAYKPISVIEIGKEEKFSLVGEVVEVGEDYFVLKDYSGKAKIKSQFKAKTGEMIRVFCRLEDGEAVAEILQSLNGLDLQLYQKADSLFRTV